MGEAQLGSQFRHHVVMEMFPMIYKYILWYTKPCNDMIEKEESICFANVIVCRHPLNPLGKIVYHHNDIAMPLGRVRVTCHEFDAPFCQRSNGDNKVQRSGWSMGFTIVYLGSMTLLDHEDAVLKASRLKVANTQNIL